MSGEKVQHTKEPWDIDGFNMAAIIKLIKKPKYSHIANFRNDENISIDEALANSHRAVLCVNSLAGISSEALEAGVVKDLIEALKKHQEAQAHIDLCGICNQGKACSSCAELMNKADQARKETLSKLGVTHG